MYDTPRTREQILTMLAEAPARIVALTQGMTVAQLLAHLRACADMWGKYIVLILSQDRPTFKAVNPTTWIKSTDYLQQEFRPMLQAYAAQRLELLAVLKPLRPEDWSRTALVTGAGKPRQRTVHTPMRYGWQTTSCRISGRSSTPSRRYGKPTSLYWLNPGSLLRSALRPGFFPGKEQA